MGREHFTETFDHLFCTTNKQTKQNKPNEIKDKLLEYLKRFYVQLIKMGKRNSREVRSCQVSTKPKEHLTYTKFECGYARKGKIMKGCLFTAYNKKRMRSKKKKKKKKKGGKKKKKKKKKKS